MKLKFLGPLATATVLVATLMAAVSLAPHHGGPAAMLTGETRSVHDPSHVVKCNGKYFVYHTGENIPMRYSTDFIHWQKGPPVFEKLPAWVRQAVPAAHRDFVWAPDLIFLHNRYYLYYSFSTFGSRTSVTGLVTSPTLDPESPDYKWTDQGLVLATTNASDYNAIDPALILDKNNDLWLTLGSWNGGGIKLVRLDNQTGKPLQNIKSITLKSIAMGQATGPEAPYLHYRDGYYYLFENEGECCKGMNSTYRIMMGRSKDITGPYLDKEGRDLAKGGGTLFMGSDGLQIGPGHVGIFREDGIDRFTFHFYDAAANGSPTLGLKSLLWTAEGWPLPGQELPPGRYAIISASSDLALGIANNRSDNDTPIDQFTYRGGTTQQWNISPAGDGFTSIASIGTGKFLGVVGGGAQGGTPINQHDWLNNDAQRWRIEAVGVGTYRVISKATGTALTLPGGSQTPLTQMQSSAWKNSPGQQWIFRRLM
jgi:arabinan endo-1,5-alpha-L-arabinosidase